MIPLSVLREYMPKLKDEDLKELGPIEYDQSKVPEVSKKHAENVRRKVYLPDMTESFARGVEYAGLMSSVATKTAQDTQLRQDSLEAYNAQVIAEMTDKDVISAPELIEARGSYATLNQRLEASEEQLYLNPKYLPAPYVSAKMDGVSDDATAVQSAVNILSALGGGTVFLPAGEMTFKTSVKWASNVSLKGTGYRSKISMVGELFSAIYNTDGLSTGASGSDESSYLTNIIFEDFQIDGSGLTYPTAHADGKGLFILYMRNAHFNRLWVHHTIGTGIGCDFLDKTTITNCIVEYCGRNYSAGGVGQSGIGVGTNSNNEESLLIHGNVCRYNGNYGIFVETQVNPNENGTIRSEGARITDNFVYGNRIGIGNKGSGGTIFSGNDIFKNTIGLQVTEGSAKDLIANNRIEDNTEQGVYVSGDYKGDIAFNGNKINRNKKGIEVVGAGATLNDLSIVGNQFSGNQYAGFDTGQAINNLSMSGNSFKGNGKANVAGQRQAVYLRENIDGLMIGGNQFEPDGTQLVAIQIAGGKTVSNGLIANNNMTKYSQANGVVTNEATLNNVVIENNGNILERQTGTTTMDGAFTYKSIDFPTAFDRAPIVAVYPSGTSANRFWVTNVTRYGFFIRTDVANTETLSWTANR